MCCFDVFHVAHLAFLLHCGLNIFLLFLLKSLFSSSSAYLPFPSVSAQLFSVFFSSSSLLTSLIPSIILLFVPRDVPLSSSSLHLHLHLLACFLSSVPCARSLSSFHHFSFFFNHSSLLIRHPLSLSPLFCSLFSSRSPSLYITICPSSYGGAPEGQSLNECECHMNFSCALFLFT